VLLFCQDVKRVRGRSRRLRRRGIINFEVIEMAKLVPINITKHPSLKPERMGKEDYLIFYAVDGVRCYSQFLTAEEVETPERKLDPDKLIQKLGEIEAQRKQLIGKVFEV